MPYIEAVIGVAVVYLIIEIGSAIGKYLKKISRDYPERKV